MGELKAKPQKWQKRDEASIIPTQLGQAFIAGVSVGLA
jgi:hypothetical protein